MVERMARAILLLVGTGIVIMDLRVENSILTDPDRLHADIFPVLSSFKRNTDQD